MITWPQTENQNPISKELFQAIVAATPPDKAILEFGSGMATEEMAKCRTVYSIEHNEKWLNRYPSNYIHVPLVHLTGFYDYERLSAALETCKGKYGSVLIDGPDSDSRMNRFVDWLLINNGVLDETVPWFFDDAAWPPFIGGLDYVRDMRGGTMFQFEITAKQWAVIPARRKE